MGGKKGTKDKITAATVKKDLFKRASDNARRLLQEKTGEVLPDTSELDDIMLPLAKWRFKEEFNIPWESDPLMYKNKNLPGAIIETIVPVGQLCSIEENSNIDGFVDNVLLSKVNLPAWMASHTIDNAKGSLKTLAKQLVSEDTQLQTRYNGYEIAFDGEKEDEDSWRAKAVVVFLKGSLLEDDIQADITIVYFLAIYYQTLSPTKTTRGIIQRNAYTAAQSFTLCNAITNLTDLEQALRSRATQTFEEHFGFKYKTKSPPDYDPNASSPLNVENNHLFYFQDLKIGDLQETVRTGFFQGLDIPEKYPTIKADALNDVVAQLKELLLVDIKSGSWSNTFISQTYSPKDPTVNPVRMNVIVVKFYDHLATSNIDPVSCTYIFCQVQLWEVRSPEKILSQDIFRMMVNQLNQHDARTHSHSSVDELRDALADYAKRMFKSAFDFEFDRTSKPEDLVPNKKCLAFPPQLREFKAYPIEETEVSRWLNSFISTSSLPQAVKGKLCEEFKEDVMYYTQNFASNSMWSSQSKSYTYNSQSSAPPANRNITDSITDSHRPVTGGAASIIKLSTTVVYGLGDMSEKGEHQYKPFVFILLFAYSAMADSDLW